MSEYVLGGENYETENSLNGKNTNFSSERIEKLKQEFQFIANSLLIVQTEIEMKMGNTQYAKELHYLVSEISKQPSRFEDLCWDIID